MGEKIDYFEKKLVSLYVEYRTPLLIEKVGKVLATLEEQHGPETIFVTTFERKIAVPDNLKGTSKSLCLRFFIDNEKAKLSETGLIRLSGFISGLLTA
jgi:hypothetical protein